MSRYQVRRSWPYDEWERGRWVVHLNGSPNAVKKNCLTKWVASRVARRLERLEDRAKRSYNV